MKLRYKIGTFITAAVALTIVSIISPPWHKAMATHYPQIWVHDTCGTIYIGVDGSGYFHFPVEVHKNGTQKFDSDKIKSGKGYETEATESTGFHHIKFYDKHINAKLACVYIYQDNSCKSNVFYTTSTNCDWHS